MATLPFSAFARKLEASARALEPSQPKIVRHGGETMEKAITAAYRARTGDGRLSGTKTKRRQAAAPVFAQMKGVQQDKSGDWTALVVPKGAYGLLEQPIEPHFIDPQHATNRGRAAARARGYRKALKQTGSSMAAAGGAAIAEARYLAGRSQALKLPDGSLRASVAHPGIPNPKRVFTPAATKAGPLVTAAMGAAALDTVHTAYRRAR